MKFPIFNLALGALSLDLLGAFSANFHVGYNVAKNGWGIPVACPSTTTTANASPTATAPARSHSTAARLLSALSSLSATSALCGMSKMNFYKRSDGHSDVYVANGDGSVIGTCYSNSDSKDCGGGASEYNDALVCYSYVCGG